MRNINFFGIICTLMGCATNDMASDNAMTSAEAVGDDTVLTNDSPTAHGTETFEVTGTSDAGKGCGDGVTENEEECDDGNSTDNDGCDTDCKLSLVVKVDAGLDHTCVLTRRGGVKCWGSNEWGQCGNASATPVGVGKVPAEIPWIETGVGATELSASSRNTCVLDDLGQVKCWGFGDYGVNGQSGRPNIGDDETPAEAQPIKLGGIALAVDVASRHACALLVGGAVRCWGSNESGALGYPGVAMVGDTIHPEDVGDVDVGASVVHMSTGGFVTCVVTTAGELFCWGENEGGLGYGNNAVIGDDETPASVGAIDLGAPVIGVDVGENHQCAWTEDRNVFCWGHGAHGALGLGSEEDVGDDEPAAAGGAVDIGAVPVAIVLGTEHSCLLSNTGELRCWGSNNTGELGYGNTEPIGDDEAPAVAGPVIFDAPMHQMSLGWGHTCALNDGGDVWCWGAGGVKLGYGSEESIGDDELPMSAGTLQIF